MTTSAASTLEEFKWSVQPQAQALINDLLDRIAAATPLFWRFEHRLKAHAGVRLRDLVDSIHVPRSEEIAGRLANSGFSHHPVPGAPNRYAHDQGLFPAVVLQSESQRLAAYLKVESLNDFLAIFQTNEPPGPPLAAVRNALINRGEPAELWAIERHGCRGFDVVEPSANEVIAILRHQQNFQLRNRMFDKPEEGFDHAEKLIRSASSDIGVDRTCDLFFAAERQYWQSRNRAGRAQKARQDRLGIGWANHDHHTYRSSREHFARLMAIFELLGFACRERFYAGAQAGWGAQILEQRNAGIIIFADVDLAPDELFNDFAHQGLAPRAVLGTVGLWCVLHGEAFLEAGMHHLECQFDFEALRDQLEVCENVKVMKPFTDFPYLRQAFTEGETWHVRRDRIDRLLSNGQISAEEASRFREKGAIGSHLENLERNDGFKGFNQTGVSEIIARTDPRTASGQQR